MIQKIKFLKLKYILLILGLILILFTFFSPLSHSFKVSYGPEEVTSTTQYGFEKITFYLGLFFIIFIIGSSYFGEGSPIALILFTLIGGSLVYFINSLRTAGWGKPCGESPTLYQDILYFAYLMIVISCFIHQLTKNKQSDTQKSIQ